jgi:hypothetical protein
VRSREDGVEEEEEVGEYCLKLIVRDARNEEGTVMSRSDGEYDHARVRHTVMLLPLRLPTASN